ncbi:MAG: hypothetical protein J7557_12310, partial [Devosia sp.]|nr:hypothetical protein [Devosia sp.]
MVDNFLSASYSNNNGNVNFAGNWSENSDNGGATGGDILVTGGRLTFASGTDNNDSIQRAINLTGATAPTLSFDYQAVGLDTGETVVVQALNGSVWETLGTLGGNATSNFSSPLNPAHSAIRFVATGGFETGESFHIDNVVVALGPNSGVDTINGDAGDDTIIWNANDTGPTDGRDIVDGGTEGTAGDTFVVNGNTASETYRIYTKAAAATAGFASAASTEIVITRQVGLAAAMVIAELREIEEIRINGIDPSGNGPAGGDTVQIFGDFSTTSLRLNTITIEGDVGDDTVDISALTSAHRIVFRSNGGHDTIIGTLRPEDVIELPNGADPAEYTSSTTDGVTTLTNGQHSISYVAAGSGPQIGGEDDDVPGDDDDDWDDDDDGDDDAPVVGGPILGTPQDDVLLGTSGGDLVFGFAGTDYIIANAGVDVIRAGAGDDFVDAGAGRDIIFADDGDDDVFGGDDDDLIYGEGGHDRLFGGSGH